MMGARTRTGGTLAVLWRGPQQHRLAGIDRQVAKGRRGVAALDVGDVVAWDGEEGQGVKLGCSASEPQLSSPHLRGSPPRGRRCECAHTRLEQEKERQASTGELPASVQLGTLPHLRSVSIMVICRALWCLLRLARAVARLQEAEQSVAHRGGGRCRQQVGAASAL